MHKQASHCNLLVVANPMHHTTGKGNPPSSPRAYFNHHHQNPSLQHEPEPSIPYQADAGQDTSKRRAKSTRRLPILPTKARQSTGGPKHDRGANHGCGNHHTWEHLLTLTYGAMLSMRPRLRLRRTPGCCRPGPSRSALTRGAGKFECTPGTSICGQGGSRSPYSYAAVILTLARHLLALSLIVIISATHFQLQQPAKLQRTRATKSRMRTTLNVHT